ncbi:uncharacterized protein [Watersipora subatra]|uniref:uncharacterized protein isoform X1 n=1 Tax=Watersipora subatra TaxID=2589382 RepID=UPI00355B635B
MAPLQSTTDAFPKPLPPPAPDFQLNVQTPYFPQTHNLAQNFDSTFVSTASLETSYPDYLLSNSKTPDLLMLSSESLPSSGQNLPMSLESLMSEGNEPSQVSPTHTVSPSAPYTLTHPSTSTMNSSLFTNPSVQKGSWPVNYSFTSDMPQVEPAYAESTSTVTVEEKEIPIDLSYGPTPPQVFRYEGQIVGEVVKLICDSKRLVFPFSLNSTVGEFTNAVQRETGSICELHTTDGFECTNGMLLKTVPLPFIIYIGNSQTTITSLEMPMASTSHATGEDEKGNERRCFGRVAKVSDVLELFNFVHGHVITGKNINAALKLTDKDRKTIDRFKNIYYLYLTNEGKLCELDEERMSNRSSLQKLDERAGQHVDWDLLKDLVKEKKATLFGTIQR